MVAVTIDALLLAGIPELITTALKIKERLE